MGTGTHTGALGDTITLGGRRPCLLGVPNPLSNGTTLGLCPPAPCCCWKPPGACPKLELMAAAPEGGAPGPDWVGPSGRDLLRASTRLEVEEVGVAWADEEGDWLDEPACGEAVPDEDSFFLASLLASRSPLVLESCSCC